MDRDTQEWGEREKNAEGCREQLKQFTHLYVPKIKMLKAYPPKVMVLVGGFFEWWLGYEGKPSWVRLVPLENWPSRAPSTTRRYSEKDSYLLSGLSPDTKSAGVIVLDFPASRTVRHKWVLLISSTVYRISVRAAQADCCCSVSMVYLTLRPLGLQHTRLPCPPLSPGVCSNSSSLARWHYLTISSSTNLFSFCLQSFPSSKSFLMSHLFASGDPSMGASASASVLPVNIQGWFPWGSTGLYICISTG